MLTEIVMSEYLDAQLNLSDNFICVVDERKENNLRNFTKWMEYLKQ